MHIVTLSPNQVITLHDFPLHSEQVLKLYFRMYEQGCGHIVPPSPVMRCGLVQPAFNKATETSLNEWLQSNKQVEFFHACLSTRKLTHIWSPLSIIPYMSLENSEQLQRRDVLRLIPAVGVAYLCNAIGCNTRDAVQPKDEKKKHVPEVAQQNLIPLELKDETLLDHGVIRVGIVSNAAEKQRIRRQIKRALRIVLADPDLAKAYRNSKAVEHLVVPDIAQTLRQIITMAPEQFEHLDIDREVLQSAHGDAYTIAVETVGQDGQLLAVQNFMLMRKPLVQPENYPQFVVTLDHECRHIMLRGKRLPRRTEELQVYTSGIERMTKVAHALQVRGGEDVELGRRILTEALPIHRERLKTWEQAKQ